MVSWLAVSQARKAEKDAPLSTTPAQQKAASTQTHLLSLGGEVLYRSALIATRSLWSFLCLQQLSGPGQVSFGFLIRRNAICHSRINEGDLRAPVESAL